MKFTISSLGFMGPAITNMSGLPRDIGIEIFYEWGSSDYWEDSLRLIMKDREGEFSIHSPFVYADIALSSDENRLFEVLREPFDLYQRYDGTFYVVHTNGPLDHPMDIKKREELRKRVMDRLFRFEKICAREGIQMVVENLGFGRGIPTLFNQHEFVNIFKQMPHLKCLIDTGHAVLADFDIYEVQKSLKSSIIAYHIHDNDGEQDQHLRVGAGCIDWDKFACGFCDFTPLSTIVLEYNQARVTDYIGDIESIASQINKYQKR